MFPTLNSFGIQYMCSTFKMCTEINFNELMLRNAEYFVSYRTVILDNYKTVFFQHVL